MRWKCGYSDTVASGEFGVYEIRITVEPQLSFVATLVQIRISIVRVRL